MAHAKPLPRYTIKPVGRLLRRSLTGAPPVAVPTVPNAVRDLAARNIAASMVANQRREWTGVAWRIY